MFRSMLLALLLVVSSAQASVADDLPKARSAYPVPHSVRDRGEVVRLPSAVTVVVPSDSTAVAVVRDTLTAAGVRTIRQVTSDPGGSELTVYVGRNDKALRALGVRDSTGLPAEGYVLAAGRNRIVLDGVDAAGTFYAAQTLRQLVGTAKSFRGTEIRDWSSLRWRGVVEGFYGPPWSHETRLSDLDYYGRQKMNAYVYTPKDDPYLRAEWRLPYPDAAIAKLRELVRRADANHVEFHYVLSPGLSVCYSKPSETEALIAKFETLRSIGVRAFVVAFDDIDYQRWNCPEDQARYGTGPAAAGTAQVEITNAVRAKIDGLQIVPTEYWGLARTGYTEVLASRLAPDVVVQWTGIDVIAGQITRKDTVQARDIFGHPILIWDNYPVNDYIPRRLLLGPFVGREPGLGAATIGLTANPMPQAHASKTSLFTVADYTWNDTAYDPARSWTAGLNDMTAGEPRTFAALLAFADQNYSSRLDSRAAPRLSERITRFWPAWTTGRSAAAEDLHRALTEVRDAPAVLRERLRDPGFLADTAQWLDLTEVWGDAAVTALDMLVAQRNGKGARAWALRQELPALIAKARSFPVEIDSAMERFVADAIAESARWLGVHPATPTTNLPLLDNRFPTTHMTDGDPATYFWGAAAARPGHHVGVDLGVAGPVTRVDVLMGKSDSPDDYIHVGVVEWSADGTTWTTGPAFSGTPEVHVELPSGTVARYVRLRSTGEQPNWVVVREFSAPGTRVSGGTAAAADNNLATASPADGPELTVTLPVARPVKEVRVLARGVADVQARVDGRWVPLGALSADGYTALPVPSRKTTDAIKLVGASQVTEVLPVYADAPSVDLTVTPVQADVIAGERTAITTTVTSTGGESYPVTLRTTAPRGITITPSSKAFVLPRGAKAELPMTVTVPPGYPTGTYPVQVTVRDVTTTLTVRVFPPTSDTNLARTGTATASAVEDDLPRFGADKAIDGDLSTRWSSPWSDDQWLQVKLERPQRVGKVVLVWEAAHARSYEIQTSRDGQTWTTRSTVTNSQGGTETIRLDAPDAGYLRMRGLARATGFGYSIHELEVYPVK